MKYRKFGKTDFNGSEIGFGAWAIGGNWGKQEKPDSLEALNTALDQGLNLIDTAAGYGGGRSEQVIAEVLKERRESIFVATKTHPEPGAWPPDPYDVADKRYSESYLRQSVEERLRFLQTDCIDLLQLHTWTRAWNDNPTPFMVLRKLQKEGKIRWIGVSTPETDQNSVIDLMRDGWVDAVQVIFNLFEQEPAAQLLPVAEATQTAILVRVPFDEGSLTGKFSEKTQFPEDDFRSSYFAGDRLARTVEHVGPVVEDAESMGFSPAALTLKFILAHPAVSTVIPGMRNADQARMNTGVSDLRDLTEGELIKLRRHQWRRSFWYAGK